MYECAGELSDQYVSQPVEVCKASLHVIPKGGSGHSVDCIFLAKETLANHFRTGYSGLLSDFYFEPLLPVELCESNLVGGSRGIEEIIHVCLLLFRLGENRGRIL